MAKVYSCVVWGGKDGKSVTINATTDLVTLTDHGTRNGKGLQFASGTLPSVAGAALALNTTYFTKWISGSAFELYYDAGLTSKIDFTSTGAGLILKSALWMGLSTVQKARYGTAGSERAYASMAAANTARSTNSLPGDEDVIEFIEKFDDFVTAAMNLSYGLADTTLWTSTMDGVRTEAFHGGFPGLGYTLTTTGAGCWYHGGNNITTDGLEFCRNNATASATFCIAPSGSNSYVQNCIVRQTGAGGSQGINVGGPCFILNCIVIGFTGPYGGIYWNGNSGSTVAHNLVTKCGVGLTAAASCSASVYNNEVVGNTLNYGASPTYTSNRFRGNIGEVTDKLAITATTGTTTLACASAPTLNINQPVMLETTGTLPGVGGVALDPTKVYYIRSVTGNNVTIASAYNGAAMTFSGAGVGTHYLRLVWATYEPVTAWIDMTDPAQVFKDFANNDFRPSGIGATPAAQAKMVDYSIVTALVNLDTDIAGNERPNYNNGGPEFKDAGPFEYDRGYGPRPSSDARGFSFTGLIAGSKVKVFVTGSDTEKFSSASSGTSETWSETTAGSITVDYTIQKAGYLPVRVVGITVTTGPSGIQSVPVSQVPARWYQASSGLTINTNCFANATTKKWGLTTTTTGQNFASYLLEQWIALGDTGEAFANKPFPIEANGPNSFTWIDGWEADTTTYPNSIANLSRDGMRYIDSSGTMTAQWAALLSAGVPTGLQVRYEQTDGGTLSNAANTGNIDQLIQVYGDATHGNYDRRGWMVCKVQAEGYDQAEVDVVAQYGALEDQLYVIALIPTANGVAAANPTVSSVTITDHGASPVTWNTKAFSITITDSGTTPGQTIMQWIRDAQANGGTFQGKNAFNWHDMVQVNGDKFKGVRGALYGDSGAALKGVRVLRGADAHPDFTLHTADDGSTVSTTPPAQATAAILANSRIQLYNITTSAELDNSFQTGTGYANTLIYGVSVGDTLRLRVCKLGYDEAEAFAVWTTTGCVFLIDQSANDVYAAWGIDGSSVTEFSGDVTGHIYIDSDDPDGVTTKTRLGAWYSWVLTTEIGIRHFFKAVTYLAANAIRVNVNVADIMIENVNATTALRFTDTDVRLYRSDGTTIIAPTSYSIHNDYSGVPDVSVVTVSGSNVITGDISDIPTAADNANAVWATADGHFVSRALRNKFVTNPSTGKATLYEDNGTTVLAQGDVFEDAEGTIRYRGQGAERRERLS